MNDSRAAAQTLMACLGEESRFRLVQALIGGARCVTDLASQVGLSQSCTTRHLQALESRRVVSGKRDGKRVLYRIREDDPELLPLLRWALDRPTVSAEVRSPRDDADGPGPAPPRAGATPRAPRSARPHARTSSDADPPGGPPLPPARDAGPPNGGTSAAGRDLPSRPVRRGGSEIEDYLL